MTRHLLTFWSIEPVASVERYHLGQLSVVRYVDDCVAAGDAHVAVICDSDVLGDAEYSRVYEISSAISSMCKQPVTIRTLTSFKREMRVDDRVIANQIVAEVASLKDRLIKSDANSHLTGIGKSWRTEQINSSEYLERITHLSQIEEIGSIDKDHLAGLVYLLTSSPRWYEPYWFASTQFALDRIAHEFGNDLEVVEGHRNRYVWYALKALSDLKKRDARFHVNIRPNLAADGSRGYMCLEEPGVALLLHAERERVVSFCTTASHRVLKSMSEVLFNSTVALSADQLAAATATLLTELQARWIFGEDRMGLLRETRPPADSVASNTGLISIHGILTRGTWQKEISAFLSAARIVYEPDDLGHLLPTVVLSKSQALKFAKELNAKYDNLGERHHVTRVSILAHSFGTRVVESLLLNIPSIRFDKVILSGSIIPQDFEWASKLDQGRINVVVNLVAASDRIVTIAKLFGRGDSGRHGFSTIHPRLIQPSVPDFGHSDWLDPALLNRYLRPLLEGTPEEAIKLWSGYERI